MKTPLLFALLLIFAAALPRASADEWISDEYHCALTIPTQESWSAGVRQALPNGEVIFHATSMVSSQGMMITYVPEMPSSNLENPAVVKRITEILESEGWSPGPAVPLVWKNRKTVQFVAQRKDIVSGKLTGIVRVTTHDRKLYIINAYGKGEADRASDPDFMRVMETFRFVDKPTVVVDRPGVSATAYRAAQLATTVAAAALLAAFAVMMFRSRPRAEQSA